MTHTAECFKHLQEPTETFIVEKFILILYSGVKQVPTQLLYFVLNNDCST